MKVIVKGIKLTPDYIPKTITITLESLEEEKGFRHLCGCVFTNDSCNCEEEVRMVQKKLDEIVIGKLVS